MVKFLLISAAITFLIGVFFHFMILRNTGANRDQREWERRKRESRNNLIFVSYGTRDQVLADDVRRMLEENSFVVKMWNPESPFDDPIKSVAEYLVAASLVITVGSPHFSDWISGEVKFAKTFGARHIHLTTEHDLEGVMPRIRELCESGQAYALDARAFYEYSYLLRNSADEKSKGQTSLFQHEAPASGVVGLAFLWYFLALAFLLLAAIAKIIILVVQGFARLA